MDELNEIGADLDEGFRVQNFDLETAAIQTRATAPLPMRRASLDQPPVEEAIALFSWTTSDGMAVHRDVPPSATDTSIVELICRRNERRLKQEGYSRNESFPIHESTMKALPCNLAILRITGCRIRTFPSLPPSIVELYAEKNDFFHLPENLASFTNLIVLELEDGRLEDLRPSLPPTLARCNVSGNALKKIHVDNFPMSLPVLSAYMNPTECTLKVTPREFETRVHFHANAHHPQFRWNAAAARVQGVQGPIARGGGAPAGLRDGRNIAADNQNVHDSGVQSSTALNIRYITSFGRHIPTRSKEQLFAAIRAGFSAAPVIQPIQHEGFFKRVLNFFRGTVPVRQTPVQANSTLAEEIIREFDLRFKTPYSMHSTTALALCERLWARIEAFPPDTRETALQRLVEEIGEARHHCMNGFMVRMVNVLQGLDENIIMRLLPRQIMQQRVPLTMRKKREKGGWEEGQEPWQWSRDCFVETCKDLDDCEERDAMRRREWLDPFYEGFVDELVKGYEPLPESTDSEGEQKAMVPIETHDAQYAKILEHKTKFVQQRFKDLTLPNEKWAKAETIARLE